MKFSIITPSFRNSQWLKLCIASVADQPGVELEHIVQDSCSDDGTQDWLPHDPRVKAFIEKDGGMYDAVNRGYRRATGDILAYLNCDEQYLPGALEIVAIFLKHIPKSKSRSPAPSSPTAKANTSATVIRWCRIRNTSGFGFPALTSSHLHPPPRHPRARHFLRHAVARPRRFPLGAGVDEEPGADGGLPISSLPSSPTPAKT